MADLTEASVEVGTQFTPYPEGKINDLGDNTQFQTPATLVSAIRAVLPKVVPTGTITGLKIIPSLSGADNEVDVSFGTGNLNGVENTSVANSLSLVIPRAASNVAIVTAVIVNNAGLIAIVAGLPSLDNTIDSSGRGGAGQAPEIPIDAFSLGNIQHFDDTDAPILELNILQFEGVEREAAFLPTFELDDFTGIVTFDKPLPAIHTGATTKAIHATVAEVVFSEQKNSNAWVPSKKTTTGSTTTVYSGTVGKQERSFNPTATFTVIMKDALTTDPIIAVEDEVTMIRYKPNRNLGPSSLTEGRLNFSVTNEATDNPVATVTLTTSEPTRDFQV